MFVGVAVKETFTFSLTIVVPGLWVGVPSVDTDIKVVCGDARDECTDSAVE